MAVQRQGAGDPKQPRWRRGPRVTACAAQGPRNPNWGAAGGFSPPGLVPALPPRPQPSRPSRVGSPVLYPHHLVAGGSPLGLPTQPAACRSPKTRRSAQLEQHSTLFPAVRLRSRKTKPTSWGRLIGQLIPPLDTDWLLLNCPPPEQRGTAEVNH